MITGPFKWGLPATYELRLAWGFARAVCSPGNWPMGYLARAVVCFAGVGLVGYGVAWPVLPPWYFIYFFSLVIAVPTLIMLGFAMLLLTVMALATRIHRSLNGLSFSPRGLMEGKEFLAFDRFGGHYVAKTWFGLKIVVLVPKSESESSSNASLPLPEGRAGERVLRCIARRIPLVRSPSGPVESPKPMTPFAHQELPRRFTLTVMSVGIVLGLATGAVMGLEQVRLDRDWTAFLFLVSLALGPGTWIVAGRFGGRILRTEARTHLASACAANAVFYFLALIAFLAIGFKDPAIRQALDQIRSGAKPLPMIEKGK